MSELARKTEHEAIPEREGHYYNNGLFSKALVYHDESLLRVQGQGERRGVPLF